MLNCPTLRMQFTSKSDFQMVQHVTGGLHNIVIVYLCYLAYGIGFNQVKRAIRG